ncbi:MAG: sigma-70 family RNA polymerase sigma factor [Patescibacteria group bacterium]
MNINNISDEKLIDLVLKDDSYYIYLMKRYEGKLSRYIRRLLVSSDEDIEDILQEVFIKAYKNLNSFDKNQKFSSWIYRISHNEAISYYRKIKARPSVVSFEEDFDIFELLPDQTNLEKEAEAEITKMSVAKVLDTLKPKYKSVLVLRYLEEKNYNEISYILKKPKGTVATLINRAKQLFKKAAEKQIPKNERP